MSNAFPMVVVVVSIWADAADTVTAVSTSPTCKVMLAVEVRFKATAMCVREAVVKPSADAVRR